MGEAVVPFNLPNSSRTGIYLLPPVILLDLKMGLVKLPRCVHNRKVQKKRKKNKREKARKIK